MTLTIINLPSESVSVTEVPSNMVLLVRIYSYLVRPLPLESISIKDALSYYVRRYIWQVHPDPYSSPLAEYYGVPED